MTPVLQLFFLSGFSALVYQVVWQRALFAIYGIHVEAVTMIVTVFMVGLGLGGLLGGKLSRAARTPPLLLFALAEAGIGAFGLASLPIFRVVGHATLRLSAITTAGVTFALLLVPTLLMGATLPLLAAHFVRAWSNVGRSVASLYTVNTLGSAAAAVAAAFALLGFLGQRGTVWIAVAGNLLVAGQAFAMWHRARTTR